MEGTDEDMYRNSHLGQRQRGLDNKSNYDPNTMLMETLKRGGAADLGKLRERTTELRHKIAEENTVYNTQASETTVNDTESK